MVCAILFFYRLLILKDFILYLFYSLQRKLAARCQKTLKVIMKRPDLAMVVAALIWSLILVLAAPLSRRGRH